MKWSLKTLESNQSDPIQFSETLALEQVIKERSSEVLTLSPVLVTGTVHYNGLEALVVAKLSYRIGLPSTRSLEPVDMDIEVDLVERYYDPTKVRAAEGDITDLAFSIEDGWLDLIPAIEDTILLHIPRQVLTPEERETGHYPSGQDWEVISDETHRHQQELTQAADPRLAVLGQWFNRDGEE